jgi:glycine dehydrogenase subunit 1
LGEDGFSLLARLNHEAALDLAARLGALDGVEVLNESFFNEFTLRLSKPAAGVVDGLAMRGVLGGVPANRLFPERGDLANDLIVAVTETNTAEDMAAFAEALAEVLS